MPRDTHALRLDDPLFAYIHPARISGTQHPIPLTATAIRVRLDGFLATVTTRRTFRNTEDHTIEATMTFPAPVHATLLDLSAEIDGRVVRGSAKRREKARQTYESAMDRGKTAVLHEEPLRGVHMVSVGHIGPGKEISVTGTWAMPVAATGRGGLLRIPVTVGEIYGRSPLADSDDLLHGGTVQEADLSVECSGGQAYLLGGKLDAGKARIRLDAPVDIEFDIEQGAAAGKVLRGVAADGRPVALDIRPAPAGDLALDAALMMDYSGSMDEPASGIPQEAYHGQIPSKLKVAHDGLRQQVPTVGPRDRVVVFQFGDDARHVPGRDFADAVANLKGTNGGTRVGRSARQVIEACKTRDILLVTDGKSHDLDVQELARAGRRFHVVLVGEDSLEANVGHLAALTGGQIFVAAGIATGEAIARAFQAMRKPVATFDLIEGAPEQAEAVVGGMLVRALWGSAVPADDAKVVGFAVPPMIAGSTEMQPPALKKGRGKAKKGSVIEGVLDGDLSRSVAAVAASLALPRMCEEEAGSLAEAEGIVCHLTSLVLVDEEGEVQEGIPAQRKVATMAPRASFGLASSATKGFAASAGGMMRSAGAGRAMMSASPGTSFSGVRALAAASAAAGEEYASARSSRSYIGGEMRRRLEASGLNMGPHTMPPSLLPGGGVGYPVLPTPVMPPRPGIPGVPGMPRMPVVPSPLPPAGPVQSAPDLKWARGGVDWSGNPEALRKGDLRGVTGKAAEALIAAAAAPLLVALAAKLKVTALALAVALLARDESARDRAASRIARAVLGSAADTEVVAASRSVGL